MQPDVILLGSVGVSSARSRALDERLTVRFPAAARRLNVLLQRLRPGSRARRLVIARAITRAYAAANRRDFELVLTFNDPGAYEYRPSADLLRALRVRDEHCRFPGCRQPVRRCDVDHTHDAALGGQTHIDNLAHLCRRHHTLKHATDWQVRQLGGGSLEWTSPTGLVYVDVPTPTLRFIPSGDPPPF